MKKLLAVMMMKLKTRLQNNLGKIANERGAKDINLKTKEEKLLGEINGAVSSFVVTFSGTTEKEDAACDKTFDEIRDAYFAGKRIVAYYDDLVSSTAVVSDHVYLELTVSYDVTVISGGQSSMNYVTAYGYYIDGSGENFNFIKCNYSKTELVIELIPTNIESAGK